MEFRGFRSSCYEGYFDRETDLINLNDGLASVEDVRWRELKHELIGAIDMGRLCGSDDRRGPEGLFVSTKWQMVEEVRMLFPVFKLRGSKLLT